MPHEFRYLFTPFRVGPLTLKNRIYSTGHAEAMAEDGKPGPRLRAYHEAKARGGCALTIVGGSSSVHPSSPASAWNMITNHDDSVVPAYRALAEAVHRHDCLVMSQLTHMGRRAQSDNESWHVLLAPSQVPEPVHREVPHELEPEQIAVLVRAFGDAVRRCREGSLDGVELSFAHNHLVDQFWSPLSNRRTDEYGGSLDNRLRFAFQVLMEIRRQVGRDYVVGARISGDELTDGGLTGDLAATSRVVARLVRALDAEVVLAGACGVEGGTGMLPALVAARLGWPCLDQVFELARESEGLAGLRRLPGGRREELIAPLPAVASVTADSVEPRYVSGVALRRAERRGHEAWDLARLGLDAASVCAWTRLRVEALDWPRPRAKRSAPAGPVRSAADRLRQLMGARPAVASPRPAAADSGGRVVNGPPAEAALRIHAFLAAGGFLAPRDT